MTDLFRARSNVTSAAFLSSLQGAGCVATADASSVRPRSRAACNRSFADNVSLTPNKRFEGSSTTHTDLALAPRKPQDRFVQNILERGFPEPPQRQRAYSTGIIPNASHTRTFVDSRSSAAVKEVLGGSKPAATSKLPFATTGGPVAAGRPTNSSVRHPSTSITGAVLRRPPAGATTHYDSVGTAALISASGSGEPSKDAALAPISEGSRKMFRSASATATSRVVVDATNPPCDVIRPQRKRAPSAAAATSIFPSADRPLESGSGSVLDSSAQLHFSAVPARIQRPPLAYEPLSVSPSTRGISGRATGAARSTCGASHLRATTTAIAPAVVSSAGASAKSHRGVLRDVDAAPLRRTVESIKAAQRAAVPEKYAPRFRSTRKTFPAMDDAAPTAGDQARGRAVSALLRGEQIPAAPVRYCKARPPSPSTSERPSRSYSAATIASNAHRADVRSWACSNATSAKKRTPSTAPRQ